MNLDRTLLLVPILSVALAAQDPTPPPGGFPIVQQLDQLVIWSDTYQTRVDIRFPNANPGPNGWPGVQLIHGGGTSRKTPVVRELAILLAQYGYVTFAYDVRGQGDTVALNPLMPGPFGDDRILLDSAECYAIVENRLGATLDSTRLGIGGRSQGGTHSRRAVAYSGRPLPLTGIVNSYPVILAAVMEITGLDSLEDHLPGGLMITSHLVENLGQDQTTALWADALIGRFNGVRTLLAADPLVNLLPRIQTNNVPILAMSAYDEKNHIPSATLDVLQTLAAGVPFKGLASTGGHGSPENDTERMWIRDTEKRWFDRFLKGAVNNGVLAEPAYESAVTPLAAAPYRSATSHWQHRFSPVWPPVVPVTTLFLRGNGSLSSVPPPAAEPSPTIKHTVPTAYDLATYWSQGSGNNPALVFASVPMVSRPFVSAPLPDDMELFGRPVFTTVVQALQGDFQFSVALLAQDPNGNERYLVGGTGAVRGQNPGNHPVTIELRDVATIIPAGSRLVVRIENLDHMRPPGLDYLYMAPLLFNYDLRVQITPGAATQIQLPLRARQAGLTPRIAEQSAAGGFSHQIEIDAGPARAGMNYGIFVGSSGFAPGVPLGGGVTFPLVIDPWTTFLAGFINTPFLPNYAGVLNAQGKATATMNIPSAVSPALAGLRFTQSALLFTGAQTQVAGPAQFSILP